MSKLDDWVQKWFAKADRDAEAARRALHDDPLPDVACYHAQQCAEKYLKGFLTAHQKQVEKTHDLLHLLGDCSQVGADFEEDLREACAQLNDYAVEVRYPSIVPEPSTDEAQAAVEAAARIRTFVLDSLDLDPLNHDT